MAASLDTQHKLALGSLYPIVWTTSQKCRNAPYWMPHKPQYDLCLSIMSAKRDIHMDSKKQANAATPGELPQQHNADSHARRGPKSCGCYLLNMTLKVH